MKVILTAFGGKLKSDFMDWPESVGSDIRLVLDLDGHFFQDRNDNIVADEPSRPVIGRFESTGRSLWKGSESAREYRMVGVDK